MISTIIDNCVGESEKFIIGFAEMKELISNSNHDYGIVIGKSLDDDIVDDIINGPTVEYFNHIKNINDELTIIIHNIGKRIIEDGYSCKIVEPSTRGADIQNYDLTLRTPVSHKMIGTRAGLGWIGKTDLFISEKFGPRLRLVSLLTDYPLQIKTTPINKSKCGKCNKCVVICPANAANGQLWDIHTDRDLFFDAHKCRNKCRELARLRLNLDTATCGICVSVCPFGKIKSDIKNIR